jgi:ribosomal protein S6
MKTLSSNYYGKVTKTSSVGFSTKKVVDFLIKEIEKRGFEYEIQKARTGTFYLTVNFCEFRISNHTKRNVSYDDVMLFETYKHKDSISIECVNIISSAMLFEFKKDIEIIFELIKNN